VGLRSKRSHRKEGILRLSICRPPKVMFVNFLFVLYAHLPSAEAPER